MPYVYETTRNQNIPDKVMSKYQYVKVGGMSESGYGTATLEVMREEKLGNYTVLFVGPWDNEKLSRVAGFCREHDCKFVMDEMINRLTGELTDKYRKVERAEHAKIVAEYRDCFDGSLIMCEYGGLMLYWPREYVKDSCMPLSATEDFALAEKELIERLRGVLRYAGQEKISSPLICIEASGGVAKHLYKAGIDRVDLEVTYNPNNEFFYSAVKGATQAFDKERFGVDMAMVWYGGNQHDDLWFKRWKNSLLHAFIRGADPIYAEHGLMDYKALGKKYDTDHPKVKQFRDVVGYLARLAQAHPRPAGFPKAKMAVIHGNLDSFAALGQTHVWGQRNNDAMKNGSAEASWELFNTFYQRLPWEFRYKCGACDFSGNPPYGQLDVIPAECSLAQMRQYDCLLFLGWNSMTDELMNKLKGFVAGGGHLLATVAHLNSATGRNQPFTLTSVDDVRELFGVTVDPVVGRDLPLGVKFKQNPSRGNYLFPLWSPNCDPKYCDGSFPMAAIDIDTAEVLAIGSEKFVDRDWHDQDVILTANQYGDGMAFLVNSLEFPGHPGLKNFYRDLLQHFNAAWQGGLTVEASDRVRYAVYEEKNYQILYLLNTEENLSQSALVSYGTNQNISVALQPGELKAVYCSDSIMAIPENILDRVVELSVENDKINCQTLNPRQAAIIFHQNGEPTLKA
jgi:hypothetical protein